MAIEYESRRIFKIIFGLLEAYLKAQQWREAYHETKKIIHKTAANTDFYNNRNGRLEIEDVKLFSRETLFFLDQLWMYYSQYRFGYSVQWQIYQNLGGEATFNYSVWQTFCQQVGWPSLLSEETELDFSLNAPKGHFPPFLDRSLLAFSPYDGFVYHCNQNQVASHSISLISEFFDKHRGIWSTEVNGKWSVQTVSFSDEKEYARELYDFELMEAYYEQLWTQEEQKIHPIDLESPSDLLTFLDSFPQVTVNASCGKGMVSVEFFDGADLVLEEIIEDALEKETPSPESKDNNALPDFLQAVVPADELPPPVSPSRKNVANDPDAKTLRQILQQSRTIGSPPLLENEQFLDLIDRHPDLVSQILPDRLKKLLTTKEVPEKLLIAAASHPAVSVRAQVALLPITPPEILSQLAIDEKALVREHVARNPYTPATVLAQLFESARPQTPNNILLRQAIAGNAQTSVSILIELSRDKSFGVLEAVGRNPQTPIEVVERLVKEGPSSIPISMGPIPCLRESVLEMLVNHPNHTVRGSLARNPNLPFWIWEKLAADPNDYVQHDIAYSDHSPAEALLKLLDRTDSLLDYAGVMVIRPQLQPEVLARLAQQQSRPGIRRSVAKHPRTPESVLVDLTHDPDEAVRQTAQTILAKKHLTDNQQ